MTSIPEIYYCDIEQRLWHRAGQLLSPRSNHASIMIENTLLVVGGRSDHAGITTGLRSERCSFGAYAITCQNATFAPLSYGDDLSKVFILDLVLYRNKDIQVSLRCMHMIITDVSKMIEVLYSLFHIENN